MTTRSGDCGLVVIGTPIEAGVIAARAVGTKVCIFARELRPPQQSGIEQLRRSSPSLLQLPAYERTHA